MEKNPQKPTLQEKFVNWRRSTEYLIVEFLLFGIFLLGVGNLVWLIWKAELYFHRSVDADQGPGTIRDRFSAPGSCPNTQPTTPQHPVNPPAPKPPTMKHSHTRKLLSLFEDVMPHCTDEQRPAREGGAEALLEVLLVMGVGWLG